MSIQPKHTCLKIGLTGGIGSGKTTVAKAFEALGVPVFYADVEAKKCMQHNEQLKKQLEEVFGPSIFQAGILQSTALAQIVFNNEQALKEINALVHPVVQKSFDNWCVQQTAPYVLKEAAILYESNAHNSLDAVVCVSAPDSLRMQRVMQRDDISKDQVQARLDKQWAQSEKIALSDYHILNDEQSLLLPQILKVNQDLLTQ